MDRDVMMTPVPRSIMRQKAAIKRTAEKDSRPWLPARARLSRWQIRHWGADEPPTLWDDDVMHRICPNTPLIRGPRPRGRDVGLDGGHFHFRLVRP